MPKVSVVTPAYNAELFIAKCIESVQAQTLQDWEMIIVDDASKDGTVAVIERYLSDSRIKLLLNEQNMRQAYTRNRAIENATGEWIAVLDADDWFAPQRLDRLVTMAEAHKVDMISDLMLRIAPDGTHLGTAWTTFGKNPRQPRFYSVYEVIPMHISCKPVISRDFIQSHNIRQVDYLKVGQDFAFTIEILIKGARFMVIPEAMYYYLVRPGSVISSHSVASYLEQNKKALEYLRSLPEVQRDRFLNRLLEQHFERVRLHALYPEFARSLKSRQWQNALKVLRAKPAVGWKWVQRIPGAIYRRLFARHQLKSYRRAD